MAGGRTTTWKPIGVTAIVCGLVTLAFVLAYHYWFMVRNPDLACYELPLPHDADVGSMDGIATWIPLGLNCRYVRSLGEAQTLQVGWELTVIAILLVALGLFLSLRRSNAP